MRNKKRKDDRISQKVYDAEYDLFHEHQGADFPTMASATCCLAMILKSKWFRNRFRNIQRIRLYFGGDGQPSYMDRGRDGVLQITLCPQHRKTLYLLHELAHCIVEDYDDGLSHGRRFCRTYLELVREFIGAEAASALRRNFARRKVRHRRRRRKKHDILEEMNLFNFL